MKKHSLASNIILFMVIIACICVTGVTANAARITSGELYRDFDLEYRDVVAIETDDINYLRELVDDCKNQMSNAHMMAEYARALHYPEDCYTITSARHDWWMYYDLWYIYRDRLETLESAKSFATKAQLEEYPVASTVWNLLKEHGYNNYVCAGIIGNMMAECGGQTLDLDYDAYNPSGYYYGLCQWNRSAYYYVFDADIEGQMKVLFDTIEYEFNTFGYCYSSYFDYDSFVEIENEQDAALAFAKCYERCGSGTYYTRQLNATEAYNYFVG